MSTDVIKPTSKGTKKLSDNPFIERITRTHISVPIGLFLSYAAILLTYSYYNYRTSVLVGIMWYLAGMLAFSLVEYVMHRYLFHMKVYSQARKKIQYIMHGVHHEYPKDQDRLAMPPIASLTIATILLFAFKLVFKHHVFIFLPGFLTGYAGYLFIHFIIHAYPPPKNKIRYLWIHHGIHHYKNPEKAFGVSSPLWDYIFRTMP